MITFSDIMYRVYRNPILKSVKKSDILEDVKGVIKLLGIPATFEEQSAVFLVENFRVALPSNFYKLRGVSAVNASGQIGTRIKSSSDSRIQQLGKTRNIATTTVVTSAQDPIVYPGATKREDNWNSVVKPSQNRSNTITYKHVPGWLYFDFEVGKVEVIYSTFMVDDNGFPLLPDNESLLLAIENYIKFKYFTILFEVGRVSEKALDRAETQYMWYMGQASNSFSTPTEDEAETIFSAICRLVPDRDAFFTNFKYNSNTEYLKLQG